MHNQEQEATATAVARNGGTSPRGGYFTLIALLRKSLEPNLRAIADSLERTANELREETP